MRTLARYAIPAFPEAGLGNELFPWAKAFIASQVLNIRLLDPAWRNRDFSYYFGTRRCYFYLQSLLCRSLPEIIFDEEEYRKTGHVDFADALLVFSKSRLQNLNYYVLRLEGMWGGYLAIAKAKPFIQSRLFSARDTDRCLFNLNRHIPDGKLRIAVHIRDFGQSTGRDVTPGSFNVNVPLEWYCNICRHLRAAFGDQVVFILFSTASADFVADYVAEFSPLQAKLLGGSPCSDILAMAQCDLIVCSISSFSMLAAWLSSSPYLWYSPHLQQHGSWASLWGHEEEQRKAGSPTCDNIARMSGVSHADMLTRGIPVAPNGQLRSSLLTYLHTLFALENPTTDLLRYGVAPL